MTDIHKRAATDLYDGESRFSHIEVDIEAESTKSNRDEDVLRAVTRIQREVKEELQCLQDELDEESEVGQ